MPSDREPTVSLTKDRSVAESLARDYAKHPSIADYINYVYQGMRELPSYGPILHQLNRMSVAVLDGIGSTSVERPIAHPAFFAGSLLALEAAEQVGGTVVRDIIYTDVNDSYNNAQTFSNGYGGTRREVLESPQTRAAHIREFFELETRDVYALEPMYGDELSLITDLAVELSPEDIQKQHEFINGYIFIRHRVGRLLAKMPDHSVLKAAEVSSTDPVDVEKLSAEMARVAEVLEEIEFDRLGDFPTRPIGPMIDQLLIEFMERNEVFADVSMVQTDQVRATSEVLGIAMSEHAQTIEGFPLLEDVQITGDTFVYSRRINKDHDAEPAPLEFVHLHEGLTLRGLLRTVWTEAVPKQTFIAEELSGVDVEADTARIGIRPWDRKITPVIVLQRAALIRGDEALTIDDDCEVIVPLDYTSLEFSALVKD